jgi:hypothetical protein
MIKLWQFCLIALLVIAAVTTLSYEIAIREYPDVKNIEVYGYIVGVSSSLLLIVLVYYVFLHRSRSGALSQVDSSRVVEPSDRETVKLLLSNEK